MRLIGYLRVSTSEQARSGLGVESQKSTIERYCHENCHTFVRHYLDDGVSGTKPVSRRPGLAAALAALAAGEADGLIVAKSDRLSRRLLIAEQLLAGPFNPKRRDAKALIIADLPVDLRTGQGRMMLRQMLVMAEFEVDLTSERTAAATVARAKRSGVTNGRSGSRLGLQWSTNDAGQTTIEINEAEQQIVNLINELRRGGMSIRSIATELNNRNLPTKSGGRWHATTIARLIA